MNTQQQPGTMQLSPSQLETKSS